MKESAPRMDVAKGIIKLDNDKKNDHENDFDTGKTI
jgi:hypothetical protein